MNIEEVMEFINSNPVCRLATVDDNRPRVRGMMIHRADETGIILQTVAPKNLFRQLNENPEVEICFNNADNSTQVRVAGTAEILTDDLLKQEVLEARPFLKSLIDQHGQDSFQVFRVVNCVATTWSMAPGFNFQMQPDWFDLKKGVKKGVRPPKSSF